MSAETLALFKDLSPFAMLILIAAMYFWVRNKEAAVSVITAQLARDTAKYNADAAQMQNERAAKKDAQDALIQLQTVAAIATIAATLKQATAAAESSGIAILDKVAASGDATRKNLALFGKYLIAGLEVALAEPPDPTAPERYDAGMKALRAEQQVAKENLEEAMEAAPKAGADTAAVPETATL